VGSPRLTRLQRVIRLELQNVIDRDAIQMAADFPGGQYSGVNELINSPAVELPAAAKLCHRQPSGLRYQGRLNQFLRFSTESSSRAKAVGLDWTRRETSMQRHNTPPTKTRVLSKPERGVTNGSLEPKTSSLKELYAELLSRALEGDRGKQNGHLRSRIAMLAATGKTMQVFCTQVFHKPPS
jgi:hypothetical protein